MFEEPAGHYSFFLQMTCKQQHEIITLNEGPVRCSRRLGVIICNSNIVVLQGGLKHGFDNIPTLNRHAL